MPYSTRQQRQKIGVLIKKEVPHDSTTTTTASSVSSVHSSTISTTTTRSITTKLQASASSSNKAPADTPRKRQKSAAVVVTPEKKKPKTLAARPPKDWEQIDALVQELRQDRTAPCDHSGAEALPDRNQSPASFRFQVLMSLVLSSQTKDAVVGEAIRSMQQDGVLSVEAIQRMPPEKLNSYIQRVGFHNNKTKYIKQTVDILVEQFGGDIPPTAAEMINILPGVGPKMAYIVENIAWERQTGIGVDTHMHRLFNKLGWVKSNTPEQTRVQLESWLPRERWGDVNLLWVGFGQEVQQFPAKILQKALDCSDPVQALKLLKRCGMDTIKTAKKAGVEDDVRRVMNSGK